MESRGSGRLLAVFLLLLCGVSLASEARGLSSLNPPRSVDGQNQLKSLSLEQLGNIEVTTVNKWPTELWNTPSAVYVITADDIRRSGATSIADALRLAPGVEVGRVSSTTWAVGIRGLENNFSKSVLLLIDGRNAYTPLFAGVYWDVQDLPLENIDRIEVIRGPGGTIWGPNAANGVINIITKKASETRGVMATGLAGTLDHTIDTLQFGFVHGNLSSRGCTAVNVIASTATRTGLVVKSALDTNEYPTKIKVTDAELGCLRLKRHDFHGEWNYTLSPRK